MAMVEAKSEEAKPSKKEDAGIAAGAPAATSTVGGKSGEPSSTVVPDVPEPVKEPTAEVKNLPEAQDNRAHPFYPVTNLLAEIVPRRGPYLSAEDLERFGIKLSSMDVETGKPEDSGPQFCDLYPSKEFDEPFEKNIYWPRYRERAYYAAYEVGLILLECLAMEEYEGFFKSKSKYYMRG